MTLEQQKARYYENEYEVLGMPSGWNTISFFDIAFLNYIQKTMNTIQFLDDDLRALFSTNEKTFELQDIIIEMICTKSNCLINSKVLAEQLEKNPSLKERFINKVVEIINKSTLFKSKIIDIITLDDELIRLLSLKPIKNLSFCSHLLSYRKLTPFQFKILTINDQNVKIFLNLPIETILNVLERLHLSIEYQDIINEKLSTLTNSEMVEILKRKYNEETQTPEYLTNIYNEYKEELQKEKLKEIINSARKGMPESLKKQIKEIISTEIGNEVLLTRILEPKFSEIINILELSKDLKTKRKEKLIELLNNYNNYDLPSIKAIFTALYFDTNTQNSILDLKTILEYAAHNEDARRFLENNHQELSNVYAFLISDELTCNPNELITTSINLQGILEELYEIFKRDLISHTTETSKKVKDLVEVKKHSNGVNVYHFDDSLMETPYFLIHSISSNDVKADKIKSQYEKKAHSKEKICFSLLGNGLAKTFLDGLIFGYNNISKYQLYSATTYDGQTNQRESTLKRQYRSNLLNLETFINLTNPKSYNEINFLTANQVLWPDYILSVNKEPTNLEYEVAKEFNIPIYVWYTKRKNKYENLTIPTTQEDYEYTDDIEIFENHSIKELSNSK